MRRARKEYHNAVRALRLDQYQLHRQKVSQALVTNKNSDFWKEIRKVKGNCDALPSVIDSMSKDEDISMSVIRTLTHRADTIISEPQDKEREMKHLKKVLSVAGYSKWAWQAPGRKKITPHPRNTDRDRTKGHVDPPLHRRRDRTHLPPNQEDRGRSTCQAPHHHQEHTSGTERQRQSPGQMWRGIPTDMPRL